MVHGQAIGIPFRRRKGEQAPPPPKEVAWNPTIESNLPYKEVKYFKFVEGAGWQALNIGEILPVGQRVMIRIVTTEPYYEVSKVVSSQMTGIQIGKNGVSEYDIVGTLTVYSPQILTVTIGVDKNYVQWNPVVESNAEYKSVKYYKLVDTSWKVINVGDYVLVGQRILTQITTVGEDEVVAAVSEQLDIYGISKNSNGEYNVLGITSSESPQKINITIDEYIRFEDIVQAYPLFFEFTDENGNLISWGGKAKVGSTITRTKSVANANLLAGMYNTSSYKLNGKPLEGNSYVVEKSMVFTCTATWKLSNEPNCILSNQILPIPNSSYKYLGHQPDLSGHGNHGVFNNFEFAGMSGANGYTEQTFSNWRYNTAEKRAEFTISNDVKLNIAKVVMARGAILYTLIGDYTTNSIQRYKVTGVDENHPIVFGNDAPFDALLTVTTDGEYEVDWKTYGKNPCIFTTWTGDCNITIEQIGEYEGAICFNGVNNSMTIPTLSHGVKQVLLKVNWHLNSNNSGIVYDQRLSSGLLPQNMIISLSADSGNIEERLAYMNEGRADVTYIDGVLNKNITVAQLQGITHNITQCNSAVTVSNSHSPVLGALAINSALLQYCAQMACFAFMSFPEISPEEEIKDLNDIVGIAGGYVERTEYYWDCFGKTNDDPDRDAITEQVSQDVANELEVTGVSYNSESGYTDDNGLLLDGIKDYAVNTNIPAITDYTYILKRNILAEKISTASAFKGNIKGGGGAFISDYIDTALRQGGWSFGASIYTDSLKTDDIIYGTKTSVNGTPINPGTNTDDAGLTIGKWNVFTKMVFYKMMLYSKTIDMLSINALKNLFALDILIDINHPIFKK